MKRDLIVWLSEGEMKTFHDVTHSWVVGNHLLFYTSGGGNHHQNGINMQEVICWEFLPVVRTEELGTSG